MTLSAATNIAQTALANSSAQAGILSKNIANASNTNYSRRLTSTISIVNGGGVQQGPAARATDNALLTNLLSAQSDSTSQKSLSDGLSQIAATLNLDAASTSTSSIANDTSPATLIGSLSIALQQYAAQPDSSALGNAAVTAAKALVSNLNSASTSVQAVRKQADSDIATSVQTINSLLAQFKTANDVVIAGSKSGADTTDAQDTRDSVLKSLSNEIGITTITNPNGGLSIYTDSGATLFETSPRSVTFASTTSFTTGSVGNAVIVDGVPVTGQLSHMPIQSGRLAGLTTLRDTTAPAYQNQLDQIASGLISGFSETDQQGGSASPLAGLFTNGGSTTIPTSVTGLAASLSISVNVDPTKGGNPALLRDGNVSNGNTAGNGNAYTYNASGDAGYAARLSALTAALSQSRSFDPTSGGAAAASLSTYATSSVSWLESTRQTASNAANYTSAVVSTTTTALSNVTGVSLDDEMSKMLDIEHAYQASAQLMNTVKSMYSSLLAAFN